MKKNSNAVFKKQDSTTQRAGKDRILRRKADSKDSKYGKYGKSDKFEKHTDKKKDSHDKRPGTNLSALKELAFKKKMNALHLRKQVCQIREECGSCAFVNESYSVKLREKHAAKVQEFQQSNLCSHCKVLDPQPSPKTEQYRNIAKLVVGVDSSADGKNSRFKIGLYQPNSHNIIDISSCPLHIKEINQTVTALKKLLHESDILPFNQKTNEGDLRYIVIRSSHITQEVQIVFVATSRKIKSSLRKICKELEFEMIKVSGAFLNINQSTGNEIFGADTTKVMGSNKLPVTLAHLNFDLSPLSFFQANPYQADNLYRRVEDLAGRPVRDQVAWDLYAGVGPISLILARLGFKVLSVEENSNATSDAEANAHRNELDEQISFINARVEDCYEKFPVWSQSPDLIVMNPSRRGMVESVRARLNEVISKNKSKGIKLIYVSCEFDTLMRDLNDLTQSGLKVRQLECYDMFAHTEKMEWIAVLA